MNTKYMNKDGITVCTHMLGTWQFGLHHPDVAIYGIKMSEKFAKPGVDAVRIAIFESDNGVDPGAKLGTFHLEQRPTWDHVWNFIMRHIKDGNEVLEVTLEKLHWYCSDVNICYTEQTNYESLCGGRTCLECKYQQHWMHGFDDFVCIDAKDVTKDDDGEHCDMLLTMVIPEEFVGDEDAMWKEIHENMDTRCTHEYDCCGHWYGSVYNHLSSKVNDRIWKIHYSSSMNV